MKHARLSRVTSWFGAPTMLSTSSIVMLLTVLALAVYASFQSVSLDDLDSYNFANALNQFRPAESMPHPPGYVMYVWLGRLALILARDPHDALVALSAVCGALACGLLFAIGRTLFNLRVALYAYVLVLVTPVMWLNADKALSDTPALLVQALCVFLVVLALTHRAPLWIAALCLGIAGGFRPQAITGLTLALLLALVRLRARPRAWLACALASLASTLAWLLPLLATFSWNVDSLIVYLSSAMSFVSAQESLFASALTPAWIAARWQDLWFWSSQAIFGPLAEWIRAALAAGTLVLVSAACIKRRKDIGIWLCVAWLAPQAVVHVLFLNPSLTRYLLAFLFPLFLLAAAGLDLLPWKRIGLASALFFMAGVGSATLPLAHSLHTVHAPPEQLAAYIAQRFSPEGTLVIARQSYPALKAHLPGWEIRFAEYFGEDSLEREIAQSAASYVVIADPRSVRPSEQYVEIETRTFVRDPQVHAKHARVEVNIYGRAIDLAMQDFSLPESGTIYLGTPQDAKYLLEGWYWREDIGGVTGRWTGSDATASLRVFLSPKTTTLTVLTRSFPPEQVVELLCNNRPLDSALIPQSWVEIAVELPVWCIQEDELTQITFRPSVLARPADDGHSTDWRKLGIAIAEVKFAP